MERETATTKADLPHEYEPGGTQGLSPCAVCAGGYDDVRHVEYTRMQHASLETAQVQRAKPIQELGS